MKLSVQFTIASMRSILLGTLMLMSNQLMAQTKAMPNFQQYPAQVSKIKAQPIQITGNNKRYKTFLTELKDKPINFAGHYVLDTYGCGGGCQGIGIYNAKTGQAFIHNEQFSECYSDKHGWHDRDYDMRSNSRLLILMGRRTKDIARCEKVYYLIQGYGLKQIASEMIFKDQS